MKEKLAIANKLRISSKTFSKNLEYRKMFSKCFRAYVVECIFYGKDDFQIIFKSTYLQPFLERMLDWLNYILDNIYRFYLVNFATKNNKTSKEYELIYYGAKKPLHLKINHTPNKYLLESFLNQNGFKIVKKHIYIESTVYDIAKI